MREDLRTQHGYVCMYCVLRRVRPCMYPNMCLTVLCLLLTFLMISSQVLRNFRISALSDLILLGGERLLQPPHHALRGVVLSVVERERQRGKKRV